MDFNHTHHDLNYTIIESEYYLNYRCLSSLIGLTIVGGVTQEPIDYTLESNKNIFYLQDSVTKELVVVHILAKRDEYDKEKIHLSVTLALDLTLSENHVEIKKDPTLDRILGEEITDVKYGKGRNGLPFISLGLSGTNPVEFPYFEIGCSVHILNGELHLSLTLNG